MFTFSCDFNLKMCLHTVFKGFFVLYCSNCLQERLTNQNPLSVHIFIGLRGALKERLFLRTKDQVTCPTVRVVINMLLFQLSMSSFNCYLFVVRV